MLAALASLLFGTSGCAGSFKDVVTQGVPNLKPAYDGNLRVWRMGQPADAVAWAYVVSEVAPATPTRVLVIKLNDDVEGNDEPALHYIGWRVVSVPIPPEDERCG